MRARQGGVCLPLLAEGRLEKLGKVNIEALRTNEANDRAGRASQLSPLEAVKSWDLADHADDGRLEPKRLRPDAYEASLRETGRDLPARSHRRLSRGAGAARLGDYGDPPSGPHEATQLLQPLVRLAPHAHVVHSQDLVERLFERRKALGRSAAQGYAAGAYGGPIAPSCLPEHDLRVIDAAHETLPRPAAQLPDRDPRSEADLKDTVGRLHPEKVDRPHVALAVRGAQCHLPPDEPAREVAGPHELRADRQRQLLLPVSDLGRPPSENPSPLAPTR